MQQDYLFMSTFHSFLAAINEVFYTVAGHFDFLDIYMYVFTHFVVYTVVIMWYLRRGVVWRERASSSGHRMIWWGDAMSICNEPNASQDHNA